MKIESLRKFSLAHSLLNVRTKARNMSLKRFSKFASMYIFYLAIVLSFDYVYMPWLAIKFRYLTFFPLAASLFIVCFLGLLVYEFFQEDIFFKEKISAWLITEGKHDFTRKLKKRINSNPSLMSAAVASYWSPLHAYIYFRRSEKIHFKEAIELIGKGSLQCAFFWGVIAAILSALWDMGKLLAGSIF